jgi:hypothetical protein
MRNSLAGKNLLGFPRKEEEEIKINYARCPMPDTQE